MNKSEKSMRTNSVALIIEMVSAGKKLSGSTHLQIGFLMILLLSGCSPQPVITSFSTGGHTVYHLQPGTVSKNGKRVIISAAYDGYVHCHTAGGKLLWKNQPGKGFPFDLEVSDIDKDGLDETLVASSDGSLYVLDNNGQLMWTFGGNPLPPLYQVIVENDSSGNTVILTGGIERILYTLSTAGVVLSKQEGGGVIRNIGKETPRIRSKCKDLKSRPYKMDFITHIKSATLGDEFMLNLSGRNLLVYSMDGTCRNVLESPYSFTGTSFDPVTNTYWLGSGISGGDGIYGIHLDKPGWEEAFRGIKPVGKMVQLEKNMATLLKQVESFQPPSYQKESTKTMILLQEMPEWDIQETLKNIRSRYIEPYALKNVSFVPFIYWHESDHHFKEYYDPGITNPKFRAQWENFHSGKGGGGIGSLLPREEIIQFAKEREQAGENFFIFAGHGRAYGIDFYISPATMVEMMKVAPNTLQGFDIAELETMDEVMERSINEQLFPFADSCYKYGKKKITILNKNIFWNGNIYLDMFKPFMADERYREIFITEMEETNSRSQSLSLAGRTGLWLTGKFNHMAGRAVTDNANYNRLWHWCQTEHLSHFLRAMSLERLQGADIFDFNIVTDNAEEMLPFYLMLEKGILPLPGKEDILSLSDLTIGIKSPDKDFLRHGTNGHGMTLYKPDEGQFVFDRLDCYWGGAMIPDHDFENYAMNAKRRMTNFIAQSPYGNMTTISAETDLSQFPFFKKMIVTDGKYWYDEAGKPQTAAAYKPVVLKELEEAAGRLPIRVYGEVAWVALRLDPTHIRLVLIDPGYLDPADREAEVVLQHVDASGAKDILSGESIKIEQGKMKLKVPMGILRIIDITHQ